MKIKKVSIWQIDRNAAAEKMFREYAFVRDELGGVDLHDYRKAYEGQVEAESLEDVYQKFNGDGLPDGWRGHSLSVSDVIVVMGRRVKYRYFYVDAVGFRELTWAEKTVPPSLKMKEIGGK